MPRLLARAAAGILALVLLVGVGRAGDRYFYCPMMRAVIDAPCCADDGRPQDDADTVEVRSRDCCEQHRIGTLPSAAVSPTPAPSEAPLLAALPPVTSLSRRFSTVTESRYEHENRAGPASTARHRAELMVFLN